jgi:hypothetical protein
MAECPIITKCPFFNDKMANMPATTQLFKRKYCLGQGKSNENCARWIVAKKLGEEYVPSDLFPNQLERV